jgi:predicted metalloprotease with PDZ domain
MNWLTRVLFSCLLLTLVPCLARADETGKPGKVNASPILLEVDAGEAPRKILHARLVIPVEPGPLTLYYPKWIPGNHGPTGPISDLAGLKIRAGDQVLPWQRDEVDVYAFHCQVPKDTKSVEVYLDYLAAGGRRGGGSTTANIAVVNWNQLLLYPKGRSQQEIEFAASLKVPAGWNLGTSLPITSRDGSMTRFGKVSLETLIDSPVHCGAYFREVPIGPADGPAHFLDLSADSPAGLDIRPEIKASYDRLIVEAGALFGARHYKSYRFLVTLSNQIPPHGLEHHESSDDGLPERALCDEKAGKALAFLLPHEYVHSWCGKYRRPAGLVVRDFQEPQRTQLLWVYEGLTNYLGEILAARCGLWTPQEARDYFAKKAAQMQNQRGRTWRPLQDTTMSPPMLAFGAGGWGSWRRGTDYYDEGSLLWLEIDTKIRQLTNGQRSLDDFCRAFFGGDSGAPAVKPFTFEDIVSGLNAVTPCDWKVLLNQRLTATADQAPLRGLEQGGWKLAYGDKPSAFEKLAQGSPRMIDLSSSIGLLLAQDGTVADVIAGKAADKAGIGPGMKLLAINSRRWSTEGLTNAVAASKTAGNALEFLLENGEFIRAHTLDYHEGPKYPYLQRDKDKPDFLAEIIKPLKPPAVTKAG